MHATREERQTQERCNGSHVDQGGETGTLLEVLWCAEGVLSKGPASLLPRVPVIPAERAAAMRTMVCEPQGIDLDGVRATGHRLRCTVGQLAMPTRIAVRCLLSVTHGTTTMGLTRHGAPGTGHKVLHVHMPPAFDTTVASGRTCAQHAACSTQESAAPGQNLRAGARQTRPWPCTWGRSPT